jgi:hypothetical protein
MLFIHDDLSDELRAHGEGSPAWRRGAELLALLHRQRGRVVVLALAPQLEGVVARGDHRPFELAIGIGPAGTRVAAALHARTGWFPTIERVDLWREEDEAGDYTLAGPAPLAAQLGRLPDVASLAVVDDTVFSGLTMRSVLAAVPAGLRARTRAFCLRGVAESLAEVARVAPVTAGFAAPGRLLHDVSFINASGLVHRGAIRRAGRPPLAFFERPEWMAAWFPDDHRQIVALCRELCDDLARPPRT